MEMEKVNKKVESSRRPSLSSILDLGFSTVVHLFWPAAGKGSGVFLRPFPFPSGAGDKLLRHDSRPNERPGLVGHYSKYMTRPRRRVHDQQQRFVLLGQEELHPSGIMFSPAGRPGGGQHDEPSFIPKSLPLEPTIASFKGIANRRSGDDPRFLQEFRGIFSDKHDVQALLGGMLSRPIQSFCATFKCCLAAKAWHPVVT
jgi:hypothetical protein